MSSRTGEVAVGRNASSNVRGLAGSPLSPESRGSVQANRGHGGEDSWRALGRSGGEEAPGMISLTEFQVHRVLRRVEPKLLPLEEVRPAASADVQRISVAGGPTELAPRARERRGRMRRMGDDLHERANDPCHIIECAAFKQVTKLVTGEVVMEVGFSPASWAGLVRLRCLIRLR